jgi:hypothetical protein
MGLLGEGGREFCINRDAAAEYAPSIFVFKHAISPPKHRLSHFVSVAQRRRRALAQQRPGAREARGPSGMRRLQLARKQPQLGDAQVRRRPVRIYQGDRGNKLSRTPRTH